MMKLIGFRSTLPALLIALGLLLTACDQGSATVPTAQAVPTQAEGTQTSGDQATAAPISDVPTDIISAEATATILVGQEGSAGVSQAGMDLTKVDPCKLLAQDDVESVMGEVPYAPKLMSQDAYHTACSYVEPTLEVDSPRLFLSLDPAETWDLRIADVQPVSGIGDGAYTHEFDGWQSLWVLLKNKVVVEMDIYPPGTEKSKQIISKAIERLP